ncbi:MAG TPA: PASTA domain-containing protein [Mycobacteriales bacterium]|nr:PASTA domain-containing protein [Mycobacteriales bacterium]
MRASGLTATILLLTFGVATSAAAAPSAGPAGPAGPATAAAVVRPATLTGTVIVPHVTFLPVDAAVDVIIVAGLWPDVRGAGTGYVIGQFPYVGTTVAAGTYVTIYTSGGGEIP